METTIVSKSTLAWELYQMKNLNSLEKHGGYLSDLAKKEKRLRENIAVCLSGALHCAFNGEYVSVELDYKDGRELINVEVAGKKQVINISHDSNQAMLVDIFKQLDIRVFMYEVEK